MYGLNTMKPDSCCLLSSRSPHVPAGPELPARLRRRVSGAHGAGAEDDEEGGQALREED